MTAPVGRSIKELNELVISNNNKSTKKPSVREGNNKNLVRNYSLFTIHYSLNKPLACVQGGA